MDLITVKAMSHRLIALGVQTLTHVGIYLEILCCQHVCFCRDFTVVALNKRSKLAPYRPAEPLRRRQAPAFGHVKSHYTISWPVW